jgi:hypothetical protein
VSFVGRQRTCYESAPPLRCDVIFSEHVFCLGKCWELVLKPLCVQCHDCFIDLGLQPRRKLVCPAASSYVSLNILEIFFGMRCVVVVILRVYKLQAALSQPIIGRSPGWLPSSHAFMLFSDEVILFSSCFVLWLFVQAMSRRAHPSNHTTGTRGTAATQGSPRLRTPAAQGPPRIVPGSSQAPASLAAGGPDTTRSRGASRGRRAQSIRARSAAGSSAATTRFRGVWRPPAKGELRHSCNSAGIIKPCKTYVIVACAQLYCTCLMHTMRNRSI